VSHTGSRLLSAYVFNCTLFALYYTLHCLCGEPPQTAHHLITSFHLPTFPSQTFRTKEEVKRSACLLRPPRHPYSRIHNKVCDVYPLVLNVEIRLSEEAHSCEVGEKCLMIRLNKSVGAFTSYLLVIVVRNCSHEP
jgi:hypothetical protein